MVTQLGKYTKNDRIVHIVDELYGIWIIIIKLLFKKPQQIQFLLCMWFLKSCPKNVTFKVNESSNEAPSHCNKLGASYGQPGVTMEKSQSSERVGCLLNIYWECANTKDTEHELCSRSFSSLPWESFSNHPGYATNIKEVI